MKLGTDIDKAAKIIRQGGLVAFPTETVFGLGADATNDHAVASIFATKGRPNFNPLIIHVANIEEAKKYVVWNETADILSQAYWPGALTLVLKRREPCAISLLASAGLDTLAIRVPNHSIAAALLKASNVPIAAPSANISGHVSATQAAHVASDFHDKDVYILDAQGAALGLESTVLYLAGGAPTLLRTGAISREALQETLGLTLDTINESHTQPTSPGQLLQHYAPRKKLRLNASSVLHDEALLAFGADVPQGARVVYNLSEAGNMDEAAANLFAMLRALDMTDARAIAAMPIPTYGLGEAINDRLRRAAH